MNSSTSIQRSTTRLRSKSGLTLVEVLVASAVLVLLVGGIFGSLIQSRKLTEGSIYQNSANTIMQGYVEQIKNMEFAELPYTDAAGNVMPGIVPGEPATLLTRNATLITDASDSTTVNQPDPFVISTATTIPDPRAILNAAAPANVADNIKTFDVNNTPNNPNDDLRLRIWLWIRDLSNPTADATQVRGITIIYSWRTNNGDEARSFVGTVRTVRSAVPTF